MRQEGAKKRGEKTGKKGEHMRKGVCPEHAAKESREKSGVSRERHARPVYMVCLEGKEGTSVYDRMAYTVGVAICCYHGHIPALSALFRSIDAQTHRPDHVVVSCSSTSPEDIPYDMGSYSFSLQIVTCREKKNAAQNRNTAASYLQTDIVTFFDADDLMHPQRIAAIHHGFSMHDAYFMVHSFQKSPVFVPYKEYSYHVNQLVVCPYGSILVRGHGMPIANGHCSVMRQILSEFAYSESVEDQGREDTVFSARIIQKYPDHTLYGSDVLSCYLPSGTGGAC